jgi:hypothetical protein
MGLGRLWHGRYPLAPTLRAVDDEADQAAQVLVDPSVVVVPWPSTAPRSPGQGRHERYAGGGGPGLPSMLRALAAVVGPERVAWLADQARVRLHAAA